MNSGMVDGVPRWSRWVTAASERGAKRVAVMWPHDENTLAVSAEAVRLSIAQVTLFGQQAVMDLLARKAGIEIRGFGIVEVPDARSSIHGAMGLARSGQADLLMNGLAYPDDVFRAALDKAEGLRTGRRLSAVSVLDVPHFERLVLVSDPGLAVAPDLEGKAAIVQNAVDVAHALGLQMPRVAILSATEVVNPKSRPSLEAAELSKMAQRGQIKGCLVDGPLALDNAISPESAAVKGIVSDVAGWADVLIGPDLETANLLVRALTHLAGAVTATVVVGGSCPIAMPSRSDTRESKLASLAVGVCLSGQK